MFPIGSRFNRKIKSSIERVRFIAERYDSLEGLISFPPERLEADIYHGSIFVYELLKNDVPERILPSLLDVSGSKKSIPEKRYFINEIISRGILEYHQTHRHD